MGFEGTFIEFGRVLIGFKMAERGLEGWVL